MMKRAGLYSDEEALCWSHQADSYEQSHLWFVQAFMPGLYIHFTESESNFQEAFSSLKQTLEAAYGRPKVMREKERNAGFSFNIFLNIMSAQTKCACEIA